MQRLRIFTCKFIENKHINSRLKEVAGGNLNTEELIVKNQDETGSLAESYNIMLRNMKKLIGTMDSSAYAVMEYADSLSKITGEATIAVNDVASTMQSVASAVQQEAMDAGDVNEKNNLLAKDIEVVFRNTNKMHDIARKTNVLSNKGLVAVDKLIESTDNSNNIREEIGEVIHKVHESSMEIQVITQTIVEISSQTNLLALNASIEAARAGEEGKGVSIEQNIAVDETKEAFETISKGLKDLNTIVDTLDNQTSDMSKKKDEIVLLVQSITAAIEETSASTEEVSAATEEELAQIEEISEHAEKLKILSKELKDAVGQFKL